MTMIALTFDNVTIPMTMILSVFQYPVVFNRHTSHSSQFLRFCSSMVEATETPTFDIELRPTEIRRPRTFHDESVPKRMPWIEKEDRGRVTLG